MAEKKSNKPQEAVEVSKKKKKSLKERIVNFFRVYKSEFKRITWTPKEQVKKNSILVIVILVASAALLSLVDVVFSKGIIALGNLL